MEWCVPPFSREDVGNDVNIEFLFDDHLVIVAGQPRGRWVLEATIDRILYRVVFTQSGPGEVYPITAHRIRRRRKR